MSDKNAKCIMVEVNDIWRHETGKRIKMIRRAESLCCGICWIAEDLDSGELMAVVEEQMNTFNWFKEK